jgi:protoporphyrinogen oxidase
VGGIARTIRYKDFCFDIGGHRFFSKSKEVERLWSEMLPDDLRERPRASRIYYRGKFFSYPLRPLEALKTLGLAESMACILSYVRARVFPIRNPGNFEDWVTNHFGRRLFATFFKTYTEKVWGMSCRDISADWAAQRITGLSLGSALLGRLRPSRHRRERVIKTLTESFRYPRKGPGMLWEACADRIRDMGNRVLLGRRVVACAWDPQAGTWEVGVEAPNGDRETVASRHLISSAPLRDLAHMVRPVLSESAMRAAESLRYRDFVTVALILKDRGRLPDNWIYVHDPTVRVGRIQNFKSWSPDMVPDPSLACYGLEYFCFEGDGVWTSRDSELVDMAIGELERIGLASREDVLDGSVARQPKAYPVYDDGYHSRVATLRWELEERFPTLQVVGRNGMHRYNNQDHSMMTAMLAVENIAAGWRAYDLWKVNQDAEYHESAEPGRPGPISGFRHVPAPAAPSVARVTDAGTTCVR